MPDPEKQSNTNTIIANFGAPNTSQSYPLMALPMISDGPQLTPTDIRKKQHVTKSEAAETSNGATKISTEKGRASNNDTNIPSNRLKSSSGITDSSGDSLKSSSDDTRAPRANKKPLNSDAKAPSKNTKSTNGDLKDSSSDSKASTKKARVPTFLASGKDGQKGTPAVAQKEGDKAKELKRLRAESENESSDDPALKRQKRLISGEKLIASVSHTLEEMRKDVFSELATIKATIAERTIKASDKAPAKEETKTEGKKSSTCSLLPPRPAAPVTQDVRELMKKIRDMNAPVTSSLSSYEKEYGDTEKRELLAQKAELEKKLKAKKNKYKKAKDKLDAARAELKGLEDNKPEATPKDYQAKRIEINKTEDMLRKRWTEFLILKDNVNATLKDARFLKGKLNFINAANNIALQQRGHLANPNIQQMPPQNGIPFQGPMHQQYPPPPLPPPPQYMNPLQQQQHHQYMMTHPPPPPPQMMTGPPQMMQPPPPPPMQQPPLPPPPMQPHVQFNQPVNYNYDPYHMQGMQRMPFIQPPPPPPPQPKVYEYNYQPNDQPKIH